MTINLRAEQLVAVHNSTGESPVWHAAEQSLYWVDIPRAMLHRYSPSTGVTQKWQAPQMLSCLSITVAPQQWVVGAQNAIALVDTRSDVLGFEPLAPLNHAMEGMRFNDGRCDRQGRFMAGTMLMDMSAAQAVGNIYQLQVTGELKCLLSGFITPNGMAFSPDGRTMYLSDSHPEVRQIWVYDYDTTEGIPSNRRPFIEMTDFQGRPDGAAIDVDGCYWTCGNDAGQVHRYTPQGRLDLSISVPVTKPSMCAFGGADMRTLFITSICPAASQNKMDGDLFAIHLPMTQGLAEPRCTYRPSAHHPFQTKEETPCISS